MRTSIEGTSALTKKNKLTDIILRASDKYAQTIQTTRQLTKNEIPPREPAVKELRKAMYDYYQARRSARGRDQYNYDMSLYTGDDSDGSVRSKKRWNNKKKSLRNNPRDKRECYGCGWKGHIKRDCRSIGNKKAGLARRTGKCFHCNKPGHQIPNAGRGIRKRSQSGS